MSISTPSAGSSSELSRSTSSAACLNSASVAGSPRRGGGPGSIGVPVGDSGRANGVTYPQRSDVRLYVAGDRETVLRELLAERQRLPRVGVAHHRSGFVDDHRVVRGTVGAVDVAFLLERTVGRPELEDGRRDAVAQRNWTVALGRLVVGGITEFRHDGVELLGGGREVGHRRIPPQQDAVGRLAQRRLTRCVHVVGRELLGDEVPVGRRVVCRPGVPHRRRGVEQVAGVDGGSRHDLADQLEHRVVPHPRHGSTREIVTAWQPSTVYCVESSDEHAGTAPTTSAAAMIGPTARRNR